MLLRCDPISRARSGQAQPPTGKFLLFARQVHLFRTGSVRIQKILRKPNHLWATGIEQRCLHHMTRKNDTQRGGIGGQLTQIRPDRKSVVQGKCVSVRVASGGGGIIKKKKKRNRKQKE